MLIIVLLSQENFATLIAHTQKIKHLLLIQRKWWSWCWRCLVSRGTDCTQDKRLLLVWSSWWS